MIHFIIEGVLGMWSLYLMIVIFRMDGELQDLSNHMDSVDSAIGLEPSYDGGASKYLMQHWEKIQALQEYLNLEYKTECSEKLPKYIKKSK